MIIYGEYLFLENSIAGLMILLLTRRICGFSSSGRRIAIGSALCGLYAFILFWESLFWWLAALFKLAFSVGIIILVFPPFNLKKAVKALLVFYLVSFAMGGTVIGSMYFFNGAGITSGGAFYIVHISYIKVMLGMVLAFAVIYAFSGFLRGKLRKGRTEAKLQVNLGDHSTVLNGFVDTGNFLRDPLSGRPVCIVTKDTIEKLTPGKSHLCVVPYKGINMDGGLLHGIRPDSAILYGEGMRPQTVNIVLAVSDRDLPTGSDGEKYDILLHEALTEGGILQGE